MAEYSIYHRRPIIHAAKSAEAYTHMYIFKLLRETILIFMYTIVETLI